MLLQQTYYSAEMDPGTPTAFKMKLLARIANDKTSLSIIAKCSKNYQDKQREKLERNTGLNSVNFYNFWLESCILISFIFHSLMPVVNRRSNIHKQTCGL